MRKFERYSNAGGKLLVIVQVWHTRVKIGEEVIGVPTSVEILDVLAEKVYEKTVAEFEQLLADRKLTRITIK